jgi:hypothetical protein
METEFPVGLTWVKAKTLSGIGSGSRVRSGPGWVTGLCLFPYQEAIGLAGLWWITARVTGLRLFPYPGVIGFAGLGRITARVTGLRHFPYLGVIGLAELARVKLQ